MFEVPHERYDGSMPKEVRIVSWVLYYTGFPFLHRVIYIHTVWQLKHHDV